MRPAGRLAGRGRGAARRPRTTAGQRAGRQVRPSGRGRCGGIAAAAAAPGRRGARRGPTSSRRATGGDARPAAPRPRTRARPGGTAARLGTARARTRPSSMTTRRAPDTTERRNAQARPAKRRPGPRPSAGAGGRPPPGRRTRGRRWRAAGPADTPAATTAADDPVTTTGATLADTGRDRPATPAGGDRDARERAARRGTGGGSTVRARRTGWRTSRLRERSEADWSAGRHGAHRGPRQPQRPAPQQTRGAVTRGPDSGAGASSATRGPSGPAVALRRRPGPSARPTPAFGTYGGRRRLPPSGSPRCPSATRRRPTAAAAGAPPAAAGPRRTSRTSGLRGDRRKRGLAALLAVARPGRGRLIAGFLLLEGLGRGGDTRARQLTAASAPPGRRRSPAGYTRYAGHGFTVACRPAGRRRRAATAWSTPASPARPALPPADHRGQHRLGAGPADRGRAAVRRQPGVRARTSGSGSKRSTTAGWTRRTGSSRSRWTGSRGTSSTAGSSAAAGRTGSTCPRRSDQWAKTSTVFQVAADTFRTS